MRVLVGILRFGENEFNECVSELKNQSHEEFEYFVIENLPNKEAHDKLYSEFMGSANQFDAFLKLDADMVFSHDHAFNQLCSQFDSSTSHVMAWVNDVPSSLSIPGIQMFRSGAIWAGSDDALNVDYAPVLSGHSKVLIGADIVDHMPNPSPIQLLRYGVHKAIKSIQPGRIKKNIKKGLLHIGVINGIARNYLAGREECVLPLIGAMLIYKGRLDRVEYNSESNRDFFDELLIDADLLASSSKEAARFWSHEVASMYRWYDAFSSQ